MKNTANVKRYFAMSLVDGRIVIATRELLTNPDYRIVAESVAREVESGKRNWRELAYELRQRDNLNPAELIKRAEQEKVKNHRPSVVTRENVEQFETNISEDEIGEIYEGETSADDDADDAPGDDTLEDAGEDAPDNKKKRGAQRRQQPRKQRNRKDVPSSDAPEATDDDADDAGDFPPADDAEDLDI